MACRWTLHSAELGFSLRGDLRGPKTSYPRPRATRSGFDERFFSWGLVVRPGERRWDRASLFCSRLSGNCCAPSLSTSSHSQRGGGGNTAPSSISSHASFLYYVFELRGVFSISSRASKTGAISSPFTHTLAQNFSSCPSARAHGRSTPARLALVARRFSASAESLGACGPLTASTSSSSSCARRDGKRLHAPRAPTAIGGEKIAPRRPTRSVSESREQEPRTHRRPTNQPWLSQKGCRLVQNVTSSLDFPTLFQKKL